MPWLRSRAASYEPHMSTYTVLFLFFKSLQLFLDGEAEIPCCFAVEETEGLRSSVLAELTQPAKGWSWESG